VPQYVGELLVCEPVQRALRERREGGVGGGEERIRAAGSERLGQAGLREGLHEDRERAVGFERGEEVLAGGGIHRLLGLKSRREKDGGEDEDEESHEKERSGGGVERLAAVYTSGRQRRGAPPEAGLPEAEAE